MEFVLFTLGIIISFVLGVAISLYFAKQSSHELRQYIPELQQDTERLRERIAELQQDNERLRRIGEGSLRLQAQEMGEELVVGEDGRYTGGLHRQGATSVVASSRVRANLSAPGPPRRHRSKVYLIAKSEQQ